MDKNRCYFCEKLCYVESAIYDKCVYRRNKSFSSQENRLYEEACTRLAVKFGRKHGWRFDGWVGFFDSSKNKWNEGAGGHAYFSSGDVVSIEDIRADLLMDAPENAYTDFIEGQVEEYYASKREKREPRHVNFRSWLLGARQNPENNTDEYEAMRKKQMDDAIRRCKEAEKELLELAQRDADDLLAESDGIY